MSKRITDSDRLGWLLTDLASRTQDVECEEVHGGHKSIYDALDAAMEKSRLRFGLAQSQEDR